MRCIDADAFINRIVFHTDFEADVKELFEDEINAEPTIEPERKKGEWIDRGWSGDGRGNSWHEWECSECKHITKGAKWDFCPKCGADNREDGSANADVES